MLFALMLTPSIFASEIYNNGTSSIASRGYLGVAYLNTDTTDEFTEAGSRIGLDFTHQIENDWTVGVTLEWATNFNNNDNISFTQGGNSNGPAGKSNESLTARHGYVSAYHDTWGTFSLGKQWATFYDVTSVTDVLNFFGGNAAGSFNAGTDGGLSGTGRVEQALVWRKSFDNLQVGLQFQAQNKSVKFDNANSEFNGEEIAAIGNGYGLSFVYNLDEFNFGIGYNTTEIDLAEPFADLGFSISDDKSIAYSISYGQWTQPGLYAAAVFATTENHEVDNEGRFFDAVGTEIIVWYVFENQISIYGGLNHLEAEESDREYELHYEFTGIEYRFTDSKGLVYLEAKFNGNTLVNGSSQDHTDFAAGFRVNF